MALATEATYDVEIGENEMNTSVQVGDTLYYQCFSSYALSTGNITDDPVLLGTVTEIKWVINNAGDYVWRIGFNYTDSGLTPINIPGSNNFTGNCKSFFLTFKKDCYVNVSSLAGYFASVTLVNNDYSNPSELFAVNSQVSLSSK